jgi:membrane protein DedA with SNARE-associated domain
MMQSSIKSMGKTKKRILQALALIFVVFVTALMVANRNQIAQLAGLGYPGIFLASLLANSTLILPIPGVLITAAMGAVFNPFWVAIAAGSGAALGELTGFMAGYSGQAIVERVAIYERVVKWMRRYGDMTILVLAFIPNPIFDVAGIAAGMLRMPLYRFLFWCMLGKILKMMVFAYGGLALGNIMQ